MKLKRLISLFAVLLAFCMALTACGAQSAVQSAASRAEEPSVSSQETSPAEETAASAEEPEEPAEEAEASAEPEVDHGAVILTVDSAIYGEAYTKGYTTLKAEEDGKIEYGEDSQAVISLVFEDGTPVDDSKIDASEAKVTLMDGDGYYTYDYQMNADTLEGSFENGALIYRWDSDSIVYDNGDYPVDNGGLEWSAQGGNGSGRYVFNLELSGLRYDGEELDPVDFRTKIYIYGREMSSRNSPMGAEETRWGVGMFSNLVLPIAEEKPLEEKPQVGDEPVLTWVGADSAGKPILCDYSTDDFYISWPEGTDASSVSDSDVTITLHSQYGDEKVLKPSTNVKTDPADDAFLPDGDYNVYSSEDTTQISLNFIYWAYAPVYNTMTIEVSGDCEASFTQDVGSVYQYSVQMGGGLDYDKTVTCASLFGLADIEDYTTEDLIKNELTYSFVFRDPENNGMGAPTLLLIDNGDGTYSFAQEERGAAKPEGSEWPTDGDVRKLGHTFFWTNHEEEKKVVIDTDDEYFSKFNGQEVSFEKSYNYGMGPIGQIDSSIHFQVAEGYVQTAMMYADHMNWPWLSFIEEENAGWVDHSLD